MERPQTRNTCGHETPADTVRCRAGPLGDRSLPRRSSGDTLGSYLVNSSGYIPGSCCKLCLTWTPPRWGDFSESANVRGHGTPADMKRPQTRYAAEPDRSEIGPYLGGLRATSRSPCLGICTGYIPGSCCKLSLTRPQASPARHGFWEPRGSGVSPSFRGRPSRRRRARPNAPRLRSIRRHEARHDRWGNPTP